MVLRYGNNGTISGKRRFLFGSCSQKTSYVDILRKSRRGSIPTRQKFPFIPLKRKQVTQPFTSKCSSTPLTLIQALMAVCQHCGKD